MEGRNPTPCLLKRWEGAAETPPAGTGIVHLIVPRPARAHGEGALRRPLLWGFSAMLAGAMALGGLAGCGGHGSGQPLAESDPTKDAGETAAAVNAAKAGGTDSTGAARPSDPTAPGLPPGEGGAPPPSDSPTPPGGGTGAPPSDSPTPPGGGSGAPPSDPAAATGGAATGGY